MKIAFLILAHGNIPQLNCFIRQLLKYDGSCVYIHLDIKAGDAEKDIIKDDRVTVIPTRLDLKWGDYTLIEATNRLLEYAYDAGHHDWYSLHSGADMAIRPVSELADFLESDGKFFYGNFGKMPMKGWDYKGGMGRLCLYWPKFFRKKAGKYSPRRILRGLYGRIYDKGLIKGKKLPEKYIFYGGSEWFTASDECIGKTLEFLKKNPDYDKLFHNALSSDEIYFNTVFEAVKGDKTGVENNHLRFIDWGERGQVKLGGPNTCAMSFLNDILKSGRFFARKFDMNFDREIVEYFENNC